VKEWYPKAHGFESGECGTRSFGKQPKGKHIMDFYEWRAGLLAKLARENIPVQQLPDGSIIAKFGSVSKVKTHEMQEADYNDYLDRMLGNSIQVEEVIVC
jgi:hypothetical protein